MIGYSDASFNFHGTMFIEPSELSLHAFRNSWIILWTSSGGLSDAGTRNDRSNLVLNILIHLNSLVSLSNNVRWTGFFFLIVPRFLSLFFPKLFPISLSSHFDFFDHLYLATKHPFSPSTVSLRMPVGWKSVLHRSNFWPNFQHLSQNPFFAKR